VTTSERSALEHVEAHDVGSEVPGVIVADGARRITAANETLLNWLGYDLGEIRTKTVDDICAEGPAWTEAEWARYRQDGTWEGEVVLVANDGRYLPRRAKATTSQVDGGDVFVSVLTATGEQHDAAEPPLSGAALPPELHAAVARTIARVEASYRGASTPDQPSGSTTASASGEVEVALADLMRIAEIHRTLEMRHGEQAVLGLRDGTHEPSAGEMRFLSEIIAASRPHGLVEVLELSDAYQTYSKPALVVLSHAVEDASSKATPGGVHLASFQHLTHFRHEVDRYREIARRVEAVHIWGSADPNLPDDLPRNLHVHVVPPGDPMLRAWFAVTFAPDFWGALITEDLSGLEGVDPSRRYRGGWTSDRGAVISAVRWIMGHGAGMPAAVPQLSDPDRDGHARQEERTREIANQLFRHLDRAVTARQAAFQGQRPLARENARLFHRERALRRDIERLVELRQLLSNSVVHDLRNTLTIAIGSLDLLLMDEAGALTADQRELAEAALQGTTRTLELAQTILDVARLEANAFPVTLTALSDALLGDIVQRVIAPRRPLGLEASIDVLGPLPPSHVDVGLLERIFANLLDNAMKYGRRSPVSVVARELDGQLEISVRDQGPGIPENVRASVFLPFQQAHADQVRSGSGLGLAFCRLACEAQGGSIRLESPADGGARFVVSLPAAGASAVAR